MSSLRRAPLLVALALGVTGCQDPTLRPAAPQAFRLIEKGPYQSVYGPDGKIDRLLYDRNGDRTADAIILYGSDGKVRQAEIDTNLDRVVDRWEYFDDGRLIRLGFTRRTPGVPDYWDVVGARDALIRREYDDDGDGLLDRSEPLGRPLL